VILIKGVGQMLSNPSRITQSVAEYAHFKTVSRDFDKKTTLVSEDRSCMALDVAG